MRRAMGTRRRSSILIAAAILLFTAQWAPTARADELEDQLKQTQQQLENLQASGQEAKARLKQLENEAVAAQAAYNKGVQDLAAARAERERVVKALADADAALRKAEAELKAVTDKLTARQKTLAARVRAMYIDGNVEYIEVLFASANFSDFLNRYEFLRIVVAQDSRLVNELKGLQKQADDNRRVATAKRDEVARLKVEAQTREQAVAQRVTDLKRLQADLARQKTELGNLLDELNRRSEQLNGVILELQRQIARRAGQIRMRYPVEPVELTDQFGMRWHPILGSYKMHYGTDFAANYGQAVYAAEEGRVLLATWDDAYGNYVVIDHGEFQGRLISTLYAHNTQLLVRAGQQVKQGQVISRAGSTGWSTGPHVHFEVRVDGTPQQPLDWLR